VTVDTVVSVAHRVAVLLAAALALTSCMGGATDATDGGRTVADQGYVSGDGSVQTWEPDERADRVTVTGTTYEGESVDTADWLGDVVVLNTWYAACPPCRTEAPALAALARDRATEGVRVLGINVEDAAGAALAFQRTFEIPYPSIDDSQGQAVAALSGTVPLQAVPTTVILDRTGRPAARIVGLAEESTLDALVDDVLAEPTGS
jgi:peroxiredoxin